MRFWGYYSPNNRTNEIKLAKNRISQILLESFEIRTNEIRIRRGFPVFEKEILDFGVFRGSLTL